MSEKHGRSGEAKKRTRLEPFFEMLASMPFPVWEEEKNAQDSFPQQVCSFVFGCLFEPQKYHGEDMIRNKIATKFSRTIDFLSNCSYAAFWLFCQKVSVPSLFLVPAKFSN